MSMQWGLVVGSGAQVPLSFLGGSDYGTGSRWGWPRVGAVRLVPFALTNEHTGAATAGCGFLTGDGAKRVVFVDFLLGEFPLSGPGRFASVKLN